MRRSCSHPRIAVRSRWLRSWELARSRSRRSSAASTATRRSSLLPWRSAPCGPSRTTFETIRFVFLGEELRAVFQQREGGSGLGREYDSEVLGEVLTAIVTPFKRDGSVDLDSFRSLARPSSTTAPTASSSPARPGRPRRSRTTSVSSSSALRWTRSAIARPWSPARARTTRATRST